MINNKYIEFLPSMQGAEELMEQVEEVSKDISSLKSCIENEVQQNLHVAVTEYAELKQQLEKNSTVIGMLKWLQGFDTAMEEYQRALLEKKYTVAATQLEKARGCLDALKAQKGCKLLLLRALRSEHTIQRENLIYHLGLEWQRLAVWKLPPTKELTSAESFLKTELHLSSSALKEEAEEGGTTPLLASVFQALGAQGQLHNKIMLFGQVLLKYILKPLATYPSLHMELKEVSGQSVVLSFQCVETTDKHPSPSQVYSKVLAVFKALHTHLFDVTVDEKKVCVILGDMIWDEMSDCIIRQCLVYSVPTDSSRLEQYSVVIKETEEFEKTLREMQYLTGESTDLLKYARNINCHFASKKCRDVILQARNLMTSEIHNTVKILPESKLSIPKLLNLEPRDEAKKQAVSAREKFRSEGLVMLENEKQLDRHTLCLPVCRISESVQKLMELALHTLSQAVGSSEQCAIQLFFAVRNIFQLFYDVVPTYHKENLLKLPQLAAIHHNNCMFIAHHLLTLGHQFRHHLPHPLCEGVGTFVDLVPGFRKQGTECFLEQMRAQRAEMLERLSTARNFANLDIEENYSNASKAVRQVIHQLKRLGTVWQDVLPVNIYCKSMGALLNTAISEIITKIMMLEDISTEDANLLHTLCKIVIDEGPLVFIPLPEEYKNRKYQEEVPVYVRKWMTFKELMIVLQANLQDIVDRWADGKGPLALEFSSNEMKSLIRALFQNTERRAIALTKIK
ncbi:centromere/kinetochore protein zw10 homolog isoform X2 [Megalops cyprinoides]|nr:centromere/kinetochore protein zw10 homolog isoform X2 [Megalops cyprinoides]